MQKFEYILFKILHLIQNILYLFHRTEQKYKYMASTSHIERKELVFSIIEEALHKYNVAQSAQGKPSYPYIYTIKLIQEQILTKSEGDNLLKDLTEVCDFKGTSRITKIKNYKGDKSKRTDAKGQTLKEIADYFDIPVGWLFTSTFI